MKAQDGSGYSENIALDIEIKDVNDHSPVVEHDVLTGYIEENAAENAQVLTSDGRPLVISARDNDVENSQLKYEIINSAVKRYFKIDEHTGDIRTTKVLKSVCPVLLIYSETLLGDVIYRQCTRYIRYCIFF